MLSGLDIDADVIRDSLASARTGKLAMRLHVATDGRTAEETDFDAAIKPFESDLHHTNRHHLISEFEAAAGVFYALLDNDSPKSLTALWEKAVENGGAPLRFDPGWRDTLIESPASTFPDAAHNFATRMRLCLTDHFVHKLAITLEPTSVVAPVLYDIPVIDFSVTRDGWAIGNYPMLGLDVFFALVDLLTRAVTGLDAKQQEQCDVPLHVLEDRFFESFMGCVGGQDYRVSTACNTCCSFHWSNSRAVGRTVWAVAVNKVADQLHGFTSDVDMVGEPFWVPYREDTEVATLFRIL